MEEVGNDRSGETRDETNVYPCGNRARIRGAKIAKMASARMLGAVNQKIPARPCVYADCTDIKSAGAQIHEDAMVNPLSSHPTSLFARRNPSLVCQPLQREKKYVIEVITTANMMRNS